MQSNLFFRFFLFFESSPGIKAALESATLKHSKQCCIRINILTLPPACRHPAHQFTKPKKPKN